MYGVIHQAARDLVRARLGEAEWETLLARSGMTERHFIGVEHHSDEDTMRLVALIAEHMNTTQEKTLHAFGRYWLEYAQASSWGRTLELAGGDLETLLRNLDRMHGRLGAAMPQARLPTFEILECSRRRIRMRYRSPRSGLAPFLQGILSAAAERFGERAQVRFRLRPDGALFLILRGAAR